MAAHILRLYPAPPQELPLAGAYLAHNLHQLGSAAAPFVYADFVSNLDGRIAVDDPRTGASHVPAALRSDNDFRLLLELQAQADCVITHGGYLRAIADGRLDDILQVGTPDLAAWREANGLAPQPAIVIASASLDFPMPLSLARHAQRVLIATGEAAPADKLAPLKAQGYDIIAAGKGRWVEGAPLTSALAKLGFRSIFLLAGPRMLETMLRDGVLSRLYLTMAHIILGGERFHTLISGPELGPAGRLRLSALHYDAMQPGGSGQWFAQFEPLRESG
ncbi:MAG TPA: dihydrofolate reductase family protein [Stellaceae bacterium]